MEFSTLLEGSCPKKVSQYYVAFIGPPYFNVFYLCAHPPWKFFEMEPVCSQFWIVRAKGFWSSQAVDYQEATMWDTPLAYKHSPSCMCVDNLSSCFFPSMDIIAAWCRASNSWLRPAYVSITLCLLFSTNSKGAVPYWHQIVNMLPDKSIW